MALKRLLLQTGYPQGIINFNTNDIHFNINDNLDKNSPPPKKMLLFYYLI